MFDAPFWALIGLVAFFAVLVYLRVPGALAANLDKRAETIRNELDQARRLREEAHALLAEYQRKAREADSEAEEITDQARREAEALALEAKRRVDEYVTSRTHLAEQKIAQAEAQAVQEVRALSAEIAVAAAGRILGERVKGEAGAALIARAIEDVKAKLN
jgi:F-type H+-transporting ATPase subunit b